MLVTNTALESKSEARNVRNYDQQIWEESAKELCYDGIKLKFTQHQWLANLLMSTNDDILGEATYDKLWGTGIPIHRNDCTDRTKWHSNGIMGEILMEIRNELKSTGSVPSHTPQTAHVHNHTELTGETVNGPRCTPNSQTEH